MATFAVLLLLVAPLGEGMPGDLFSFVLANAGDLDRDGTPDVLVSDPVDADRSVCAGCVWAVSGKDSKVLQRWRGERGEQLGTTLGSTGDLDGDGVPDVFLGTGSRRVSEGRVWVRDGQSAVWRVVSGRTGAELRRFEGFAHDSRDSDGPSFAPLRDVDGDEVPDFAIGSARGMRNRTFGTLTVLRSFGSRVAAISGKTGKEIWRVDPAGHDEVVGDQLVAAGDVDADGIVDLLASVTNSAAASECARVLSGKDGRILRSLAWEGDRGYEGPRLASGADLDGDKLEDAIVAMGSGLRRAVCFSGGTGKALREWRTDSDVMYSTAPYFVPDANGDGTVDVVLTLPGSFSDRSSFLVVSGTGKGETLLDVGFPAWESTHFACSVLSVPDRDGDGVADLLVGEASQRHHGWLGEARYYSTRSGRMLGSFTRAALEAETKK